MTTETAPPPTAPKPVSPVLAPANRDEYNRTNLNFRLPMPRPKVRGITIDFHCHLFAARHAKDWFEAADHYGLDCFLTMTPLEEAVGILRDHPDRVRFIAVPKWIGPLAYGGPSCSTKVGAPARACRICS